MEMLAHAHVLVNVSSTALVCIVDLVDLTYVDWHGTYAEELLLQCSLVRGSSTSLFCESLWIGMVP